MNDRGMSKEKWVAMFRHIGLDEARMTEWHRLFESRHPDEHRAFLEWLQIPPAEIEAIRAL